MITLIQFRTLFRTKSAAPLLLWPALLAFSCTTSPENRPSPLRTEYGEVGTGNVEITFSSPAVRNRQIFGVGEDYLEPFGELWRTGANKATSIYFDQDVVLDDVLIDSGTYSIFTIPEKDQWTLIINENWDQWGEYDYQESLDVLRTLVRVQSLPTPAERMRLYVENEELKFEWEYTAWSIPINLP